MVDLEVPIDGCEDENHRNGPEQGLRRELGQLSVLEDIAACCSHTLKGRRRDGVVRCARCHDLRKRKLMVARSSEVDDSFFFSDPTHAKPASPHQFVQVRIRTRSVAVSGRRLFCPWGVFSQSSDQLDTPPMHEAVRVPCHFRGVLELEVGSRGLDLAAHFRMRRSMPSVEASGRLAGCP